MSQNVESTKMLLLHNTRETLARLHNRRIRTCAQPTKQKCNDFYPKYAICMIFQCFDPRWSSMTILMLYDAMVLAYKLFAYRSLLLKSLFGSLLFELFSHAMLHEPRYQLYMRWQPWDTRYDTKICNNDVCMLWEVWSLMCTSLVAGHIQRLVSMGKWSKGVRLWWLSM